MSRVLLGVSVAACGTMLGGVGTGLVWLWHHPLLAFGHLTVPELKVAAVPAGHTAPRRRYGPIVRALPQHTSHDSRCTSR